jgi:hypothetical protein
MRDKFECVVVNFLRADVNKMILVFAAVVVAKQSFGAVLESVQKQINESEQFLTDRVESVIRSAQEKHQKVADAYESHAPPPISLIQTYEIIPTPIDSNYGPVESWVVGIYDGQAWTRPPTLAYFLGPFRKSQRISLPPVNGQWVANGIDGLFVFRFAKRTDVSRIVFAPFQSAPCNGRDIVIDGFTGEEWARLGNFTLPNGATRYQEFPLRRVQELRGCRIFASNNHGDPSRTCLSKVQFSTRVKE